jgi:arylsulfatase A-like enzyme
LADDTLVICTTDHGIAFPTMKCNLTDGGMGVMLIMRGPGGFTGGRAVDALVSQIDIYPTVCDLLGLEIPPWVEGRSFMPVVRGEAEEVNPEVFGEVSFHACYEPQRAVRTRVWKYIRRFGDRDRPVLPNCDESVSKDLWIRHGWREMKIPEERLFNMVLDPNETNNLACDPSFAGILEDMRQRLQGWMKRTSDPLIEGPIVPPSGALLNDPDARSPKEKRFVVT